jgi:hypothetical protein
MKLTHDQLNKIKAHFKLPPREMDIIILLLEAIVGWALAHADFV